MSIDTQRIYVCQGRPRHLQELEEAARKAGRYDWWPIKKSAHPGNAVIFYLKSPISAFVASGIVDSEVFSCPDETSEFHGRPCVWISDVRMLPRPVALQDAAQHIPEWKFLQMPQAKAEVPSEWVESFLKLLQFEASETTREPANRNPKMKELKALLEQFGQMILYGPPGTGKTRETKRVALALLAGSESTANTASTDEDIEEQLKPFKDAGRFDLVVFHPAYEYEQFVGGIEPIPVGQQISFQAKAGVFTRLCRKAQAGKLPAVLVIDEINRGNLPKLLGELVYALEYRGHEVKLPFEANGRTDLKVPKNLYVIATMNSADRSIGHIDVAIRRRFGLYPLQPNPDVVRQVWSSVGDEPYGKQLADLMSRINAKLRSGPDAAAASEWGVGQSYFLPKPGASVDAAKKQVEMKWTYQVQPLLREYEQLLNLDAHSLQEFYKPLEKCL
jgi:hypothetical protein